ncbi:hypothetical protein HFD98_23225 [Pseudomonas sp. EKM23D]|uniref:hypothetical protein n=1 Tax=Pseudomonas sp. EKM23D TaxID=2708062 RepID=UPI00142E1DD5|nr:hypothetical protein [Pseudomonas sp. EKM23D]KAF6687522.1 hypothetical protein HFD98_23225 [Pseudomonas sp. EKM23D]
MKITLFPFFSDWPLEASVSGDVITINGEDIDLSGIPDGYRLPASAVENKFFLTGSSDYVERIGKTLHFSLKLPLSMESPNEYRSPPEPIIIDARSGPVKFPDTSPVVIPAAELPDIREGQENGGLEQA